jgi:hypothetical protein
VFEEVGLGAVVIVSVDGQSGWSGAGDLHGGGDNTQIEAEQETADGEEDGTKDGGCFAHSELKKPVVPLLFYL